jgi:exopolysaccharide biosynthesis polyprenyl glycosylphosphotransferase
VFRDGRSSMVSQRSKFYQSLHYVIDLTLTATSLPLAYYLRRIGPELLPSSFAGFFHPELRPISDYLLLFMVILPVWGVALFWMGSHRLLPTRSYWDHLLSLGKLETVGILILGFVSFALELNLSRPLLALYVAINATTLLLFRALLKWKVRYQTSRDYHCRNVMVIGADAKALAFGKLLEQHRIYGIKLLGHVALPGEAGMPLAADENPSSVMMPPEARLLGGIEDMPRILQDEVVDEIVFAGMGCRDIDRFEPIFRQCEELGIKTSLAADLFPRSIARISLDYLDHVPLITFTSAPDHELALFVKRLVDVVLASLLLLIVSPLMALVGLIIRFTSPGPVFYHQIRCGLYGRRFKLIKFRSMINGAEDVLWEIRHLNEMSGPVFKMRNDPRVTPFGHFLRRTSIDELPQFWNVLKGEMSLVGPRAPLPDEVAAYANGQRRRLSVKPGITCLWQVSGRNQIDFEQWMALDLQYIDNWSLLLDLQILARTLPVVLLGRGAH